MRRLACVFSLITVFALIPFFVSAETKCLRSGESVSFYSKSSVKEQVSKQVSCADLCSDERVTLTEHSFSASLKIETTRACKTKEDHEKYGCKSGQTQPRIEIVLAKGNDSEEVVVSKCEKTLEDALISSIDTKSTAPLQDLAEKLAQSGARPPGPTTAIESRTQNVIAGAFGRDATDAAALEDPDTFRQFEEAVAGGDTEKAGELAKKLELNEQTARDMAVLEGMRQGNLQPVAADVGVAAKTGDPTGFAGSAGFEDARNALASIESGGDYHAVGPQTRTGNRAYGRYQVMDFNVPSWTARACGRAYTPGQFLSDTGCQEQVFNVYYSKAVAQCGSYAAAAAKWHSGRCSPPGGANDGYITTSQYVNRFNRALGRAVPFGGIARAYNPGYSPFANIVPSGASSGSSVGAAANNPFAFLINLIKKQRSSSDDSTNNSRSQNDPRAVSSQILQGNDAQSDVPQQALEPNASIIVQPKTIDKGDPFVVSWSSVGINPLDPCRLYLEVGGTNELLMHLNEGSRTFKTTATSTAGTWNFVLQCPVSSGEILKRTASTTVE